jgi:hypothetical protein
MTLLIATAKKAERTPWDLLKSKLTRVKHSDLMGTNKRYI